MITCSQKFKRTLMKPSEKVVLQILARKLKAHADEKLVLRETLLEARGDVRGAIECDGERRAYLHAARLDERLALPGFAP